MSVLVWVFGCVVGAVTWQAVLRLPGAICRWFSPPFEKPGRATGAFGLLVALLFLFILATIVLRAVFALVISSSQYVDDAVLTKMEAALFGSSIAGFAGFAIVSQLLNALGPKKKRKPAVSDGMQHIV